MRKLFFLFAMVLVSACGHSQTNKSENSNEKQSLKISLSGTKWQCKIAEGCINVYEFKNDSSYIFHSCEMEQSYYGVYSFKQDTLILDEKWIDCDMDDNTYKAIRMKYYVVIKDGKLKHLKVYDWFDGKYELSDFKFDDSYLYTKVE